MTTATRRDILRAGAALGVLLMVRPARATPVEMRVAIEAFTKGAPVSSGKVDLVLPPLVENGNSVPVTVNVAHWMRPDDHVKAVALFNEKNPQPNVAIFHLSHRAGRATVSTRIRLGDSQKIVAIAQLSDGTFWSDEAEVIVTLPACAES
ncbi:sulfur oxidation protein SoxY [Skermanella stibiiresistens SB22]|uniref:Sulfur oxidation protein SoxY n=1 Tax=Skermanella stibiiresistens SB22 TaxID=1385369 RepID=W9GV49_9PROT|nr:SoxY-related AACIE arm protein [Skermanella stibiiresistens]EWY37654.1 sulfur oxidation protein SoxY [Skermanella stibiiresistens SB22]